MLGKSRKLHTDILLLLLLLTGSSQNTQSLQPDYNKSPVQFTENMITTQEQ